MPRRPSEKAFLRQQSPRLLHFRLAEVDKAGGSDIRQTFLSLPRYALAMNQLHSAR
jgi:hypothetical protein